MLKKVVFLDRDGVINRDSPEYIKNWSEFRFLPGSLEALKRLKQSGFTTILITNQSGIHRKLIPVADLDEMHANLRRAAIAHDGRIDDIFYCPHLPEEGCNCRKPKPGMIFDAQKRHNIDLSDSLMVGDSVKDIECARNAGCAWAILVSTGNGKAAGRILSERQTPPDHVAKDLLDAVAWFIDRH